MKNFFIKSLLFTVILCLGLVGTYFVIRARSGTTVTAGDKLTATKWNELATKVTTLETTVSVINSIPAGSIVAFNSSTCPTGRKAADGTNSTVDLRGEFIRGWDNGRGVDSGRTLGSSQNGSYIPLGNAGGVLWLHGLNDSAGTQSYWRNVSSANTKGGANAFDSTWWTDSVSSTAVGDTLSLAQNTSFQYGRVRPRNISLLYCVKQ